MLYVSTSVSMRSLPRLLTRNTVKCCRYVSESKVNNNQIKVLGRQFTADEDTNITEHLLKHTEHPLHLRKQHPIQMVKQRIVENIQARYLWNNRSPLFAHFDNVPPIVTHAQNFDELLVPGNHVSRKKQENYFINKEMMLRAHMTCHDQDMIRSGLDAFLTTGDVYRRDTIDRTHYPVFHQMDGVRLFSPWEMEDFAQNPKDFKAFDETESGDPAKLQPCHTAETVRILEFSLKNTLIGIVQTLFGRCKYRWVETTFPFTHPSWELEIFYQDEWLEVLGCGILQQNILKNSGVPNKVGWAFGLGLERLAMAMYNVPDIRLFWSEDPRFLDQFKVDNIHRPIKFEAYSNFTARTRDIAFWLPTGYEENDFYDFVRNTMPRDAIEDIKLIDTFTKQDRTSHCYRLVYRAWDRHLSVEEANELHETLAGHVVSTIGGEVR